MRRMLTGLTRVMLSRPANSCNLSIPLSKPASSPPSATCRSSQEHECFASKGFERLYIQDIYRLATAIVFPSELEGRGLPIIESSAAGIPIICSRYFPAEVFGDVVGEDMDAEKQIRYTLFEEEGFSEKFLSEVIELLLFPAKGVERKEHNIQAVKLRYNMAVLRDTFAELLDKLSRI